MEAQTVKSSYRNIILLMLAGESIFVLPFLLARIYRPTFLEVFKLTNFELGTIYSTYGIVAVVSYLFGGALADLYEPRKLIAGGLIITGMGGFFLMFYPSFLQLQLLYAFWGFSTIYLFWAAMIKAARSWGGSLQQGRAFGLLEGGRGIVAATIGALGVFLFSKLLPVDVSGANFQQRQDAFANVILFSSLWVFTVGILIALFLKEEQTTATATLKQSTWKQLKTAVQFPTMGMLILIVLCAYIGYKVTDILSLFAAEVMAFDEVAAAQVGSYQMYLRPIICVIIGELADKSTNSRWLLRGFAVLLLGAALFSSGWVQKDTQVLFFVAVILVALATYGLRTLYFAAVQEGQIPYVHMGTAVGIISVIGYTPDVFMGPLMGYLLDHFPGLVGHQLVFGVLALAGLIGIVAVWRFQKILHRLKSS